MRYSLNNYVEAFIQASEKVSKEKAVAGLVKLLKKTGDIRHLNKMIEAIQRRLVNDEGGKWVVVETARKSENAEKSFKNEFSKKDHLEFKLNPELVAGVRITVNGDEELDNSLTNKLNKLFR